MSTKYLKSLLCLFLLAASFSTAEGLFVVEKNDDIEMFRTDVRWFEIELINRLDFPLENVRVEIEYPDGVRPLRDEDWKGRSGISHARYAQKDSKNSRIIVELPSVRENSAEEMWFAFVGQRYGVYNFDAKTYLQDETGDWAPSDEVIEKMVEEIEAEAELEEEIVKATVETVSAEPPPRPRRTLRIRWPEIKGGFNSILLAILIGINLILIVLVVYSLLSVRKVRREQVFPPTDSDSREKDEDDFLSDEDSANDEPSDEISPPEEESRTENPLSAWDFTRDIDTETHDDEGSVEPDEPESPAEEIEPEIPSEPSPEPISEKPELSSEMISAEQNEAPEPFPAVEQPEPMPVESLFDRLERAERELKRDIFDSFETSPHKKLAELILDNELLKNRLRILREMAEKRDKRS